ncbi:MAG: hypothetical protein EOM67_08545 [Spirochaetia bacterium]|nr:hypothetical protein [Spirochaetia bacterium]
MIKDEKEYTARVSVSEMELIMTVQTDEVYFSVYSYNNEQYNSGFPIFVEGQLTPEGCIGRYLYKTIKETLDEVRGSDQVEEVYIHIEIDKNYKGPFIEEVKEWVKQYECSD